MRVNVLAAIETVELWHLREWFVLISVERKAHPPLGATAEVNHGFEVVDTGNHVNRTAPSGWMVRLVRFEAIAQTYLWGSH
jgi:hypothetical protein